MRSFRTVLLITIALALSLFGCAESAVASPGTAPIDSSASGVYVGSDRVCRVVLARYQTHWVQADIRCLTFSGSQSASLTTIWSPGTCPQGGALWLNPWPAGAVPEFLSLRAYVDADQTLSIVRGGNQTAVTNGVGTAETWYRIGFAPSPGPYACPAATGRKG